jgi:hypothetical protein
MASPFQQQSLRRKVIYTILIVALFSFSLVLRQMSAKGIEAQAEALEIKERNIGEQELSGAAIRLLLTGSRGLAVCILWQSAIEMQKKHEWNELEILVNSVTKLQPHFVTPWLFQSWNLAYNVSVESDRIRDKYFYVTRGIELLADGERQNKSNPDLRFAMGFYNQNKFGMADETTTFRCLFEMSCIDPLKRDPNRFRRGGSSGIDMIELERFCTEHPRLVRRLREGLKRDTPADIVDFLAENQKIPTRYDEKARPAGSGEELATPLKEKDRQFPVQAPLASEDESEPADPDSPKVDCFQVARDWYTYAVKPMPPPEPEITAGGQTYDPHKYRMPRGMMPVIFRGYPSRGQAYVAEGLEKEGWFDRDGWKINGWFTDNKFQGGGDSVVGKDQDWAGQAWRRTFDMYRRLGKATGLYLEPEEMEALERKADEYRKHYGIRPGEMGREPPPEDMAKYRDGYRANGQIFWYERLRMTTNFPHFYFTSQVYGEPESLAVRKALFEAELLRKLGERELALDAYQKALPRWRDILLAHAEFRRDEVVQDETFEYVVKYFNLVGELHGRRYKELAVLADFLGQAAGRAPLAPAYLPPAALVRGLPPSLVTPIDVLDPQGHPLIREDVRQRYRERIGIPNQIVPTYTPDMMQRARGMKDREAIQRNMPKSQNPGTPQ